ncbi:MAG: FAD-dependent oxidoreductase [Cytophagales bacterium]|nr:FAD-dependent oxidoreductase [Bernardetiaceae bacterium]MDW8204791.1 FAD-dependent oxidoreductase [Cytophagales bacterium]
MEIRTFAPPSERPVVLLKAVPLLKAKSEIVVVGAGAFGGWTALHLQLLGYRVTLIDAFGPGNSRSSSGDETRVIRSTYGSNETYFDLNRRAWQLWQNYEALWGVKLLHRTGVLWLCYQPEVPFIDATLPYMKKHGLSYEYISADEARYRYPQIFFDDLHHAVLDREAGYLMAREGCKAVVAAFIQAGGHYIQAQALPLPIKNGQLPGVVLSTGSIVQAQAYVWACGAWLGYLFPEILGNVITATRQEVYYFGMPEAHAAAWEALPVWIDWSRGEEFFYGIPGSGYRGFKVAYDKRGEIIHPTHMDRQPTASLVEQSRRFLAHRFPAMAHAPLVEARVCQYENSPDGNFILDCHPEANNCWFLGGGSGHGYKHGPALGEWAAQIITGAKPIETLFSLARITTA